MKRFFLASLVLLASSLVVSFGFLDAGAREASQPVILTEKQIEAIRDRCIASKVALDKLHSSDALLRVTLGQQYENISTRMMAPLNSRIALNSYDGVELAQTTVDFNIALDDFRKDYQTYESSVDVTLNIDCQANPVGYYAAIENARQRRQQLHDSTRAINNLAKKYLNQFDAFAAEVKKGGNQ